MSLLIAPHNHWLKPLDDFCPLLCFVLHYACFHDRLYYGFVAIVSLSVALLLPHEADCVFLYAGEIWKREIRCAVSRYFLSERKISPKRQFGRIEDVCGVFASHQGCVNDGDHAHMVIAERRPVCELANSSQRDWRWRI